MVATSTSHHDDVIEGLVSTIIPVYNRPEMILRAVNSVLSQTYQRFEIIIVDDGSTDNTSSVLSELSAMHPDLIKVFTQANSGASMARNTGLQNARGEFIQYLDSDDVLLPCKFTVQTEVLNRHDDAGLCYGITHRRNQEDKEVVWAQTDRAIESIFPNFLLKRGWDTNSPLWRRTSCNRIGPWGKFRVNEDWEHDLRAGILGIKPIHVSEPVAVVFDHQSDRASGMNSGFTPEIIEGMVLSHQSIWNIMKKANLTDWSYLEMFSKKIFWLARLCDQHAMPDYASVAMSMAAEMMARHSAIWKLRTYRAASKIFGGERMAHLLDILHEYRRRRPSIEKVSIEA